MGLKKQTKQLNIMYLTQCTGFISNACFVNLYLFKLCVSMFHQYVAMTLQTTLLPAWSLCYGRSRKMENWKNDGNKTPWLPPINTQIHPKNDIMQIWQSLIYVTLFCCVLIIRLGCSSFFFKLDCITWFLLLDTRFSVLNLQPICPCLYKCY